MDKSDKRNLATATTLIDALVELVDGWKDDKSTELETWHEQNPVDLEQSMDARPDDDHGDKLDEEESVLRLMLISVEDAKEQINEFKKQFEETPIISKGDVKGSSFNHLRK